MPTSLTEGTHFLFPEEWKEIRGIFNNPNLYLARVLSACSEVTQDAHFCQFDLEASTNRKSTISAVTYERLLAYTFLSCYNVTWRKEKHSVSGLELDRTGCPSGRLNTDRAFPTLAVLFCWILSRSLCGWILLLGK
jgi:hypothetical protein